MKSFPRLAFAIAVLLTGVFVLVFLQRHTSRDVLRISISRNHTHMAVGQTSRLQAYEEYQDGSIDGARAASTTGDVSRALITPRWRVSDQQVVSISEDGMLKALKPGRATVESHWEGFASSTTIDVVKDLPSGVLPQV